MCCAWGFCHMVNKPLPQIREDFYSHQAMIKEYNQFKKLKQKKIIHEKKKPINKVIHK